MASVIIGLGNPGTEYESTRHNAGRMAVEFFAKKHDFKEWKEEKSSKALVSSGLLEREAVALVLPNTFMNKSGAAAVKFVKSQKAAERMIVVYDDLDLPIGKIKLSFDRGSGGHKGLESIIAAVKTKKFARIRIGVSPTTAAGKMKKPDTEKAVLKFILEKFKTHELEELKTIFKKVNLALEALVLKGPERAMNEFN